MSQAAADVVVMAGGSTTIPAATMDGTVLQVTSPSSGSRLVAPCSCNTGSSCSCTTTFSGLTEG
eukprot:350503-Hanusia_phi.AAC.1